MLVLSRKAKETICISQHSLMIEVTVVEVMGNRVRLAVKAPKEIKISRPDEKEKEIVGD